MQAFLRSREDIMKIFESFKDIDDGLPISTQLVAAKLLCGLIEACIDGNGIYEPEDDGRVVLIDGHGGKD
jgi:hypothetical protein